MAAKPKNRLPSLFSTSSISTNEDASSQHHSEHSSSTRSHSPAPRPRNPSYNYRIPSGSTFSSLDSAAAGNLDPRVADALDQGVLLPPPPLTAGYFNRPASPDAYSRPNTASSSRPSTPTIRLNGSEPTTPITPTAPGLVEVKEEKRKRMAWLPGRSKTREKEERGPPAWIVGHDEKVAYEHTADLLGAERIPELWDENGNTFVYLAPRTSGKGPSFRIHTSVFASSAVLMKLAFGDANGIRPATAGAQRQVSLEASMPNLSLNGPQTPPLTPRRNFSGLLSGRVSSTSSHESRSMMDSFEELPRDLHLYLPIALATGSSAPASQGAAVQPGTENLETLVAVRNLFAFLVGQSLVATEKWSSMFAIFIGISELLRLFEFSNIDGSTYGEVASSSFDDYVEELGLADVRTSREKTVEGIVLGERMRSVLLYNEAFTHCVGKHDEVIKLNSAKFRLISPLTVNRLSRAALDLEKRVEGIRSRLEDFDFPSIFAGIMNSKTADERKSVRFAEWKDSFMTMRRFVIALYKHKYGSWPPKASSKKNDLETSGLNRLVLRDLYHDFSSLYDLLVDRQRFTSRTADGVLHDDETEAADPTARALWHVMSEYDRSSPPVKPPVPFDLPQIPSLATIRPGFGTGDAKKDAKARSKKLKDDDVANLLRSSCNHDVVLSPFIEAFRDMERRSSRGSTIDQIVDARMGQWIFMYAVLQALPMLVVDAPALQHTKGVEYFLCEPPRSGVPWAKEDVGVKKGWYEVRGGGAVVSLPSDLVVHGVEGIYRRSHCWQMAEKWSAGHPEFTLPVDNEYQREPALQQHESMQYIDAGQHAQPGAPAPTQLAPPITLNGSGLQPGSRQRSPAPSRRGNRESVMLLGLEALPLPP
ncbi:hypothetical protein LTR66_014185, partial [Elasticomyces elasticus]